MNTPTAHRHPHRRLALLLLLTTASFSLLTPAGAQVVAPVPPVINYQGRVTDAAGQPIGGAGATNRKMIFRIWDAATGGTRLWTEEQTVTIAAGEFSVLLGSGINATGTAAGESRPSLEAVFNSEASTPGGARYLEVMVDEGGGTIDGSDVAISPRQQLTTTAYSFRARRADTVADNAIGSAAIANGAITQLKLATSSVNSSTIMNGTIATEDLADGAVTAAKLGSNVLLWTLTGGDVFRASGRVGIGVTTVGANAKFHVRDSLPVTSYIGQWRSLSAVSGPTNAVVMGEFDSNGATPGGQVAVIGGHNADLTAWAPLAINPGGGNVGIGTSSPGATLDVNGSVAISSVLNLPATNLGGTAGVISLGTVRIHASNSVTNFFAGSSAGNFTMSGGSNTGIGWQSLNVTTTGSSNTAMGSHALLDNSTGSSNTAVGASALKSTTSGSGNTATGRNALESNTGGGFNTGVGGVALSLNSSGDFNTGVGYQALLNNTTGSDNTAIGRDAGPNSGNLNNTTCLGADARATASNMVRIGNGAVTVIQGQVAFTVSSDRNLKENFVPVDGAEVIRKILGMELTSWNFIGHDKTKFRHYGPMAQDFFAAFGHDAVGTIGSDTTINSGDLSGILLSAVQELARKLEVKDAEVKALQKKTAELAAVQKRLAELEAQDKAREARLVAIEKQLLSSDKPAARTASLKQGGGAE